MNPEIGVTQQLAMAERTAAAVRRSSRWAIWMYVANGAFSYMLAVSITAPLNRPAFWIADGVFVAFSIVSGFFIRRRPVVPRGYDVRHAAVLGAFAAAWGLLLVYGFPTFHRDPAFWISAGTVPTLIAYTGAFLEYRAVRR